MSKTLETLTLAAFRLVGTAVTLPVMFGPAILWYTIYTVVDPTDPLAKLVTIGAGFFFLGAVQLGLLALGIVVLAMLWTRT